MATSPLNKNPFWSRLSTVSGKGRSVQESDLSTSSVYSDEGEDRCVSVGSYQPMGHSKPHTAPETYLDRLASRQPTMIETTDKSGYIKIKQFSGHKDEVHSCQFCGFYEEKLLTASYDSTIKLFDFEQGKCLSTYRGGHNMNVTKARASPDTQMIVSSGWDKKINMWNTETGQILWTGHHLGIVTSCCFSNDGKYVMSVSDLDNSIKIWDAYTGEQLIFVEDFHDSTITSCTFSPADDRVVTTSMDRTTKFYDLSSRSNTLTLKDHTNIVSDVAFTKDERKLATVSWDKGIHYYDISTGMFRSQGPQKVEKAHEGCISCCSFSDDGVVLATGGYDCCVCIWDVENNVQKLKLQGHSDWIEDVALKKDGKWMMTASKDHTVRVWNIENTDKIPMVLEKRKAIGLKIFKCSQCGKPFSVADAETSDEVQLCVFCRLQVVEERDANIL